MSEVLDRPLDQQDASAKARLRIIDCDIHPSLHSRADLNPFLARRWQEHMKTYGDHLRTPYIGTTPYPRSSPLIARRDAWPPTGGPPGSDLAFMRKQHLDPLDVEGIEMLPAHEVEIGARRPTGRRPRIAPRDQWRRPRIGRGADIGRAQMVAVGF